MFKHASSCRRILVGLLCLICVGAIANADEGITVSASGEVKGRPTVVEIGATVSGEAELTADAIMKYREARKKGIDAINKLKLPNVSVESSGYAVNSAVDPQQQMRMMQGMGGGNQLKQKVQVTEQMKLTIKDADKMEPEKLMDTILKVIDAGKDAGLVMGPPPATNYYEMQIRMASGNGNSMVLFKLGDITKLKEEAYKDAMDSAKAKRLAELAGVKLGRVLSVQEGQPSDSQDNTRAMVYARFGIPFLPNEQNDVSSNLCTDIPVKVVLTVQYAIQK